MATALPPKPESKTPECVHSIILVPGPMTPELTILFNQKKIKILDRDMTKETASDKMFNENKYMGTLCLEVATGTTLAIPEAADYLTKKGGLSLSYHFATKIPGTSSANYSFILVYDTDTKDPDLKTKEGQLLKWATENARVMTVSEFTTYNIPIPAAMTTPYKMSVTCGRLTTHKQNNVNVTGHSTCNYAITCDEAQLLQENNQIHMGKTYNGTIVKLSVDGKDGGIIIQISSLGDTVHITNNTTIKSSLSGPVLEKMNSNIMEFNLQDIDKTAKQNPRLKIEKVGETEVTITGWYCYAIESRK